MTKKQLCEICTEYSTETKCDIEDTCELQNILQENTELKRQLKQIKKAYELGKVEGQKSEDVIRKTDVVELLRRGKTYAFHHPEQYKTEREADIVDTLYVNLIQAVDKLPPVNPQYTENEIQKMQDLEQAELEKAYELGKAEGQISEDAISRQAVLDLCDSKDPDYKAIHFKEDVECLPSVNPQAETTTVTVGRMKGETIMWYECYACGEPVDRKDCYCSMCGRKLIHEQ